MQQRVRFRCSTNFAATSLFDVTGREARRMSSEAYGDRVRITCLVAEQRPPAERPRWKEMWRIKFGMSLNIYIKQRECNTNDMHKKVFFLSLVGDFEWGNISRVKCTVKEKQIHLSPFKTHRHMFVLNSLQDLQERPALLGKNRSLSQ